MAVNFNKKEKDGREMDNIIKITDQGKKPVLLPMKGQDNKGNMYEVDSLSFLKNGRRFYPIMGEFHFSRYEPEDWEEELLKIRAGGVGIVATYVFWIHHEEREGEWNFNGCRNLRHFLQICKKIDMPVWLRIGPWAHGECRNGGFPDWLITGNYPVRTNNPSYLERVKVLFAKLGEQAEEMMCKDGGTIIGIQLENEYGHCGGSSDYNEGMEHMHTLKKMALEAGFVVPYYTATGWGGAYVIDKETLPVLGGYVDAPWADHVKEMPANENFIFSSYKQDDNIGSDLKKVKEHNFTFDIHNNPYLTTELGGGLQVTSHRRTYPWPEDIEAQALCMLGSGANLLGYYMYHGGINPDGKYTTLQESRVTGYNNDLPVKSYDFQTCIRESGEISASFGRLKKLHMMLSDFGELLAGADTYFSEIQPLSPEDCHTLRVTARVNHRAGVGFLFINNHQRKRKMEEQKDCSVRLVFGENELVLPHITVKSGECAILPFRIPFLQSDCNEEENELISIIPEQTNASLLCKMGSRSFFYSDSQEPYFKWNENTPDAVILTRQQADQAYRAGNKLYITEKPDSCLIEQDGQIFLLTKSEQETLTVYGENGNPGIIQVSTEAVKISVKADSVKEAKAEDGTVDYHEYLIQVGQVPADRLHQLYLELDYAGDRAEVYINGKLVDDWFTTGEKWHLALKRFGYPNELILRIYPSDKPISNPYENQVYYDLTLEKGCELSGVKAFTEYKISL